MRMDFKTFSIIFAVVFVVVIGVCVACIMANGTDNSEPTSTMNPYETPPEMFEPNMPYNLMENLANEGALN